jgi:uncharacterized protein involved in type VI secretion and phage assembly
MSLLEALQQPEQQEQGTIEGVAIGVVTWRENRRESHWARVASIGGGKDRGLYWIPEVEDEVLVICDKKDMQHMYVIGSLWNGQDKPPDGNADGENNIRLLKTRNGHEIRLVDKKGQGQVIVKSEKGYSVVIDDKDSKIEISGGTNKVTIQVAQNGITIESGATISIKSKSISIEASASMTLKSGGPMKLEGTPILLN